MARRKKTRRPRRPREEGNPAALKPWQRYLADRLTYVAGALIVGMLQGSNQTRKAVEPVIRELRQDVAAAQDDAATEKDLRVYYQSP